MKILPKIDIHVHSIPTVFVLRPDGSTFATPRQLRTMYDRLGIEKALLLPTINDGDNDMREVYEMVRDNPDVFGWWFANVPTHTSENCPENDLSCELKQLMGFGARGVGEVCENLPFDDPYMLNLLRQTEKLGLPLTFHIGNNGHDYGIVDTLGLPGLEKALKSFPKLRFLGHSQKFWAEISGDATEENRRGYPTGKVVPGGRVPELMRRYPNLNCDLSAGSGYNAVSRDPDFGYAFLEEFQDRCFFGTDICDPRNIDDVRVRLASFLDDGMKNGKLSYNAYEKISRGNAEDLLD